MADMVSRIYSNFRGVDFRGEEINLVRSPDSLNVWKDYKETDSIRTRPDMKLFMEFPLGINGLFFYNDAVLVHTEKQLRKVKDGVTETLVPFSFNTGGSYNTTVRLDNNMSHGFVYENKFYIMDGTNYLCYDGEKMTELYRANMSLPLVNCYIPTTSIGRKPSGGGTVYEDVNLLSEWRINTFLSDGKSTEYYLDAQNISISRPVVTVNGVDKGDFDVNYTTGCIKFQTAPAAPLTDGQDNVVIKFKKAVAGNAERILGCTLSQVFDNRVFVTGNPNYPNTVWHCSLNDPTYFSDLDYYREGMDDAKITGMVAGNNALWVFREPSDANTTVFYHTPTIDEEYGKIYPSTHSSITMGCVGSAINFNDDIVFFSQRGMEGISGDVTTEQVVAHRSSLVDRKLLAEADYKNMLLAEWEGYLMVFIGSKVYLADSRTAFTIENHIEYEWFYWDLGMTITYAKVYDGVLYLGTESGIYTLTDYESDVESCWVTPKDKFKYPHKLKTTNKRGCVAEATGDVSVYAKIEDTDFELIGEYKNVTDYFVSRIKRKKFKDIQLKFHSKTRFSLETVTLEAWVGGYIKR